MNAHSVGWLETTQAPLVAADDELRGRKASLLAILSEGLPALPNLLFRLNAILTASPVDLKEVSLIVRSDPSLAAQLLRLCNSALFGLRKRVIRVEDAAILLGTERLRSLVFACSLIQMSCRNLSSEEVEPFWTHSLTTAMLSECLARRLNLEGADQAYLGGFLHDAGKLPLLMVAAEENSSSAIWLKPDDGDSLALEREYFGLDHCEAGRWLGINWNFAAPLVEVLDSHHEPHQAYFAPLLVGAIATADHYCERMESGAPCEPASDRFYRFSLPWLSEPGRALLLGLLRREYPLMRKLVESERYIPGASGQTGKHPA